MGLAVWLLQALLKVLDFDDGNCINVNGEYDAATAKVVQKLQEHLQIEQTGVFDTLTRNAFDQEFTGLKLSDILANAFTL